MCMQTFAFFSCFNRLPYLNLVVVFHLIFLFPVPLEKGVIEQLGGHLVPSRGQPTTQRQPGVAFQQHLSASSALVGTAFQAPWTSLRAV